ncbi:MAG: TonB-dependent receptor, partial [Clostridia bacterium]|nr:TonB-dependent receptor [Clostridia bacterium]
SARQKRWNEKVDYSPDAWCLGHKNPLRGTYQELYTRDEQLDATFLLNADYTIGDNISLGGIVGYNLNQISYSDLDSYLSGLNNPGWFSLENGADKPVTTSEFSRKRLMGAFAQADFGYKNYFFVSASARNDWSSTLPINSNSFFYWGLNSSFVFTDCFSQLKDLGISFLKLRAAYGKTGNDAPRYKTSSSFYPTQVGLGFGDIYLPINGIPGLTESNTLANMNLKPEITTEWEIGLSANFLDNRIKFDGAYYDKVTKDQIISAAVSPETGYRDRTRNVGEIGNRGIELMLNVTPVKSRNVEWVIGTTFTKNWSEVLKLWDDIKEFNLASAYQVSYVAEVGKPLGQFKVPALTYDDQGRVVVASNGFPAIDNSKKETIGTSNVDFQMGFNTRISWKNLSFSAVMDWRKGGYFYCYTSQLYTFSGNSTPTVYNDRQPFIIPNSVKKNSAGDYVENDIPIRWASTYGYYNNASNLAQYRNWVLKKDYLKVRELVISYDLPEKLCEKTKMFKGITISAIGRNLFMWTPKENNFVDPEGTNYGNDLVSEFGEFASGPTYRTFGGSIKITF